MGGILNATFGNIAELDHRLLRPDRGPDRGRQGIPDRARSSATLLLVLGASVLIGGLRNGNQRFSVRTAMLDATLLVLAVIGLFRARGLRALVGR